MNFSIIQKVQNQRNRFDIDESLYDVVFDDYSMSFREAQNAISDMTKNWSISLQGLVNNMK